MTADLTLFWSQGFGYVKFSHSASAMAALEQLNGLEFPPASSQYLKVLPLSLLPCSGDWPGLQHLGAVHTGCSISESHSEQALPNNVTGQIM